MRNTSPRSCPGKSPQGKPPEPRCVPVRRGFLPASRWGTSASTISPPSGATLSPTWPPGRSSPRRPTSSCSAPRNRENPPRGRLELRASQLGHRVLFATAIDWVARLQAAHQGGRLPQELVRLRRYGPIIVDEVGYIPFEQDAPNLFFQLVSSRYEHASLILTSNLPFARRGDVFGDPVVVSAMIDCLCDSLFQRAFRKHRGPLIGATRPVASVPDPRKWDGGVIQEGRPMGASAFAAFTSTCPPPSPGDGLDRRMTGSRFGGSMRVGVRRTS
jgi:hypothetical protein